MLLYDNIINNFHFSVVIAKKFFFLQLKNKKGHLMRYMQGRPIYNYHMVINISITCKSFFMSVVYSILVHYLLGKNKVQLKNIYF